MCEVCVCVRARVLVLVHVISDPFLHRSDLMIAPYIRLARYNRIIRSLTVSLVIAVNLKYKRRFLTTHHIDLHSGRIDWSEPTFHSVTYKN